MPSVSTKQQRAMHAAAAGHSTLGIPKKVGQEFAAADKARGHKKLPMRKAPKRDEVKAEPSKHAKRMYGDKA